MFIGRVEANHWGSGDEGAWHGRSGFSMNIQGDVKEEEAGRTVGEGGAGPWVGIIPSAGCDIGMRVMISSGIEVEVRVL